MARTIRSKVVIHWNHDKTKWWFQVEDAFGIIFCSSEYNSQDDVRAVIKRLKKVVSNRFMKIEVYSGE
jgi:hypothetical protein